MLKVSLKASISSLISYLFTWACHGQSDLARFFFWLFYWKKAQSMLFCTSGSLKFKLEIAVVCVVMCAWKRKACAFDLILSEIWSNISENCRSHFKMNRVDGCWRMVRVTFSSQNSAATASTCVLQPHDDAHPLRPYGEHRQPRGCLVHSEFARI